MNNLDKILEGLLFLSGDGLDRGVIMEKLQVKPKELEKAIEKLKERYNDDCGINFITYKDKLQLCGNPKFADDVSLVLNPIRERQLTKATLEVMAIIAYKQPVTRLDVQDIRGINSDYAIQTLLNYKLIEVVGRKDAVGKPLLFGTTDEFLRHFGINNLDELPDYAELMKNVEMIQLENNHLYNEFDIPNEEDEKEENIVAFDKEAINDLVEENEEKIVSKIEDKNNVEIPLENEEVVLDKVEEVVEQKEEQNEEPKKQPKKEKKASKKNESKISKIAEKLEEIDYSYLEENEDFEEEKNYTFDNVEQKKEETLKFEPKVESALEIKTEKVEEKEESANNFADDGIDWSLLEDNPDIDFE